MMGTAVRNGSYKIRLGIRSKRKGKRGGARVITYVKVIAETVYLVSIYDKSEQADITDAEPTNKSVSIRTVCVICVPYLCPRFRANTSPKNCFRFDSCR